MTQIPKEAHSAASARVSCMTPPLLAVYEMRRGRPTADVAEAMLMILPLLWGIILRATAWLIQKVPVKLVSITRSPIVPGSSRLRVYGSSCPAPLTRISIRPSAPATCSTAAETDSGSVTSHAIGEGSTAHRFDLLCDGSHSLSGAGEHRHVRTGAGQSHGDRFAEPLSASCDNRDFPGESKKSFDERHEHPLPLVCQCCQSLPYLFPTIRPRLGWTCTRTGVEQLLKRT